MRPVYETLPGWAEPLAGVARAVKTALHAGMVQTVGNATAPVERVAIVCGAGGELAIVQ